LPVGEGEYVCRYHRFDYNESPNVSLKTTQGATWDEIDIPTKLKPKANEYRIKMLEAVADEDDTLLEKILKTEKRFPQRKFFKSYDVLTIKGGIISSPLWFFFKNKGVQDLMDALLISYRRLEILTTEKFTDTILTNMMNVIRK